MSSGMKLRSTIRAPARYGESESETPTAALLQSMRRAREASSDIKSPDQIEASSPERRPSHRPRPKQHVVEYNPALPPAAFPTLNEPVPTQVGTLTPIRWIIN